MPKPKPIGRNPLLRGKITKADMEVLTDQDIIDHVELLIGRQWTNAAIKLEIQCWMRTNYPNHKGLDPYRLSDLLRLGRAQFQKRAKLKPEELREKVHETLQSIARDATTSKAVALKALEQMARLHGLDADFRQIQADNTDERAAQMRAAAQSLSKLHTPENVPSKGGK